MKDKTNLDVGKIKQLMTEKAMGPEDVGRKIGVCEDMVRNWLRTGEATPERAADLAGALGLTITEISVA